MDSEAQDCKKWIDFDNNFKYEKILYDVLTPWGEIIKGCWVNNGWLNANDGRMFDTEFGIRVCPSTEFFGEENMLKKEMQYIIYTTDSCIKCIEQKKKWNAEGTVYEERDAERIKSPQDDYDREALIEASINNMELPVIIKI